MSDDEQQQQHQVQPLAHDADDDQQQQHQVQPLADDDQHLEPQLVDQDSDLEPETSSDSGVSATESVYDVKCSFCEDDIDEDTLEEDAILCQNCYEYVHRAAACSGIADRDELFLLDVNEQYECQFCTGAA